MLNKQHYLKSRDPLLCASTVAILVCLFISPAICFRSLAFVFICFIGSVCRSFTIDPHMFYNLISLSTKHEGITLLEELNKNKTPEMNKGTAKEGKVGRGLCNIIILALYQLRFISHVHFFPFMITHFFITRALYRDYR